MIDSLETTIACVVGIFATGFGVCKRFFNGRRERQGPCEPQYSEREVEEGKRLVRGEEGRGALDKRVETGFLHVNERFDRFTDTVTKWHNGE